MINIVYKNYNFGSIFKLSPGLYFTNNLLGDYDCFEGFGRCDNKCVFCCDSDSSQYSNDLSIKLSSLSNGKILLCCGEPTGIKDIVKTVKGLKHKYATVAISTNGKKLADLKFLQALISAGVNELFFSIHGHKAVIHDSITGVKNSFAQSVKGLRNALKLQYQQGGFEVAVNAVVTVKNLSYLKAYLDFLYKLGIETVNFDLPVPLGIAEKSYRRIMPQFSQVALRIEKTVESFLMRRLRLFVSNLPLCVLNRIKGMNYSLILIENREFVPLRCNKSSINCADCINNRVCIGALKKYVDIYGDREFKGRMKWPAERALS